MILQKQTKITLSKRQQHQLGRHQRARIIAASVHTVKKRCQIFALVSLTMITLLLGQTAVAGPREQAKRIHDRIAGVPPTAATLDAMAADITAGAPNTAAQRAINHPDFYRTTLKNWITPWTNFDGTIFDSLNDYSATVIGMIRDDHDFREILSADILYIGDPSLNLPAYSNTSNAHYEALENQAIDLQANLVATTQSAVTGLQAPATAGIMTTRAAAKGFFIDGTNRAMLRFTLMNHLCRDLEQVKDITRPPDRIRQDVTRSPGGDSRIFLNNCVGCHSGMDPLAQAFSYYEYQHEENDPEGLQGQLSYNAPGMLDPTTGTRVQQKYLINANNFQYGFATPDDAWENYWREGQNKLLGWDESLPGSGNGAKSLGQELAHSDAFAICQVEKVFKAMCLREPGNTADRNQVTSMVSSFRTAGYNIKQVFVESAVYCMGD